MSAVRPYSDYGAVVFRGRESVVHPKAGEARLPAAGGRDRQILPDRQAAGRQQETLEIFAFMDAAQRSKEQGGKPVGLR